MQDLIKQEQFEIEILNFLNSKKLLQKLIFCGGTMLRLCYGLNRFSVDLDFWLIKKVNVNSVFLLLKNYIEQSYNVIDAQNKFYTILFEIKSQKYPRSLKIEIRKEPKKVKIEKAIAFSRFSDIQVLVNVPTLQDVMLAKINAFLDRKEIRDVFDIEFLLKRGIHLPSNKELLKKLLNNIEKLTRRDYSVKLGSILEDKDRRYYINENFKILRMAIEEILRKS